ncbi:ribonuclease T2-like [Tulasnella sp. JGI-2019a]|nr:ribonuclease T2-like [Tulasnella sp. JGI-2019a]
MFVTALLSTLGLAATAVSAGVSGVPNLSRYAYSDPFAWQTGCSTQANVPYSCQNTTAQLNQCCFESPGGLLMSVQLWDTTGNTGTDDEWTIHGLWPDYCNGSWGQFCDAAREYPNITQVLIQNGATDLLRFMQEHWLDQGGDNESFWEHEWNKHGTCLSTLEPPCMPSGKPTGYDATRFFHTATNLYKGLPTYLILASAGIFPSTTRNYTYTQLAHTVKSRIGITPAFDCDNSTTIFEISYYHHLKGSIVDGKWERIDAYVNGSCSQTLPLQYLPKPKTVRQTII